MLSKYELQAIRTVHPDRRWINYSNLKRLSGHGEDAANTLDFAINEFVRQGKISLPKDEPEQCLQREYSFDLHIFPPDIEGDQFFLFWAERELITAYEDSDAKFVKNGDRIFFKDTRQRIVAINMYPASARDNTVGNIGIWETGGGGTLPLRRYFTAQSDWILTKTNISNPYVVYLHSIKTKEQGESQPSGLLAYIGITKQGWQKRFSQHMSDAKKGSRTYFHRALRDHYSGAAIVHHRVLSLAENEDEALDAEERFVEGIQEGYKQFDSLQKEYTGDDRWVFGTLYPKGLNMIPGGKAGWKVLHKMGAINDGVPLTVDQKEKKLMEALVGNGRAGKANPLVAAHWQDDDYAMKIICGPEGRLKPNQIREARLLGALGRDTDEIADIVGAKNEKQIKNLLDGKTYSRINKDS